MAPLGSVCIDGPLVSVCPKVIVNAQPKVAVTRRTSSSAAVAPPVRIVWTEEMSRGRRSSSSSIAISIVGTARKTVAPKASMRSSSSDASKPAIITWVPPIDTIPSEAVPQDPMWNIGIALTHPHRSRRPARWATKRALLTTPRWLSSTPLGTLVVPEVYCSIAPSSGVTAGRARDSTRSTSEPQRDSETASRSAGAARDASSIAPCRSTPR